MKWIQNNSVFVIFLHITLYKKETKERGKIMHVKVRTASWKPSIGVADGHIW